jgi:hypothetical protein
MDATKLRELLDSLKRIQEVLVRVATGERIQNFEQEYKNRYLEIEADIESAPPFPNK